MRRSARAPERASSSDPWPVLYQRWEDLLFFHWPFPPERIRPLVPGGLELDTWKGRAWVSMTPFTISGVRPPLLPPLPIVSRTHELNVRTYVRRDDVPGVWFLSLDANNPLAVVAARLGFGLPYYAAWIAFDRRSERFGFRSTRAHPGAPAAELNVTWSREGEARPALVGSIEFFLVERYVLYAVRLGRLWRTSIAHPPWTLRKAAVLSFSSSMLESHGLSSGGEAPLVHAQGEPFVVETSAPWPA
jgi:uncharacterized protein